MARKSVKKLVPELAKDHNATLQGQNSKKRALYSVWSGRQDSNLRPLLPKSSALPTVPRPDIFIIPQCRKKTMPVLAARVLL